MSKYRELRINQPQLTIKEGAREVIFKLVSCMCNNVSYMKFYKNDNGDFRMQSTTKNGMGNALSNFQMKHTKEEIEWEADDENWNTVIEMINSGTSLIEEVKSR
jgi:hypothetical protein